MRQEVLLQSLGNMDPGAVTPTTALEMATLRGAAALGLGDDLGSIEPGKLADIVCVDAASPHLQPVLDPVWTIVNRAHGHDVAHVVVDGRVVVRNAKLTLIDEADLTTEVTGVAAAYLRRAGVDA